MVVAVAGLAALAIVYFAIGRRPPPAAPVDLKRIDPAASAESSGCTMQRFRGEKRDFELTCETQLAYPDGSLRMLKVNIKVTKPDGRRYVVDAGEAHAGHDQKDLQLSAGVKLRASDGFELTADRASYSSEQGTFHTDVPVSFSKARMHGSGTNVDYSEASDVLTIADTARVTTTDEQGRTTLDFAAGTASLDRLHDVLTMAGGVHVLRDQQVMDAQRAVAHLAPNDEFVTFIELRDNSRVAGGGGTLDAMSARDIDLDYSDDGTHLERVVLTGTGAVTLTGSAGAAGRQLMAESLDIRLAADGSVTSAAGRENVRMVLPATADGPSRTVRSRALDAIGAAGQGLTSAHFADNVEYREESLPSSPGRVIRSARLDLTLSGAEVAKAAFSGEVTFDEPTFRAQAADAGYDPAAGSLHLSGGDRRGLPCIADDQIAVDADTIDITVDSRRLNADGQVKTTIRPAGATGAVGSSPCAVARQRAATGAARQVAGERAGETRLPGLLQQDQIATATADALQYGGTGQSLMYTGNAYLSQGDTTLRGNRIRIDQERGDLVVTGNARSRTWQGAGEDRELVQGQAEEIRYDDSKRTISYLNGPGGKATAPDKLVQVNGPQGNLAATTIDIVLNKEDGKADRLEAYQKVTARIDSKIATADRLTYIAATDQYDMSGAGTVPVRITDACGETSGKTLTYFKSKNTIEVRSNDQLRAQTRSAACQQPSAASR
jgi:lipopolysaccharide export system protein LptA